MKQYSLLLILCVTVWLSSCKNTAQPEAAAFDVAGMDTTIQPGDNFFKYANGKWLATTKIPDDQSGWGSFYSLYDNNLKKLRIILDGLAANTNHPKGSAAQKVGDYYASGMDTATIEKRGSDPLKNTLAKIAAVTTYQQLVQLMGDEMKLANDFSPIGYYVSADEKNSSKNILVLVQAGLSLPEKSYYTKTDSILGKI